MAYEKKVTEVVEKLGYQWMIVDGTGIEDGQRWRDYIYREKGGRLLYFPRINSVSYKIAFGKIRTLKGLVKSAGTDEAGKSGYMVLGMDGETFGHHQPKQMALLEEILASQKRGGKFRLVTISELVGLYNNRMETEVAPSTWGYTKILNGKRIWVRWRNPASPLHKLLSELRELAINSVHQGDMQSRHMLDRALNSDTFWWASGSPCWHSGMVDRGAAMLCEVVQRSRHASPEDKKQAMELYSKILKTGFKVFGTKDIAC
jgi:predicted glycosyl hydrolase (DUF1957 family)